MFVYESLRIWQIGVYTTIQRDARVNSCTFLQSMCDLVYLLTL